MDPWFLWFLEFVPCYLEMVTGYLEMVTGYPVVVPGYIIGNWCPLVPGLGPCTRFNPLVPRCCP